MNLKQYNTPKVALIALWVVHGFGVLGLVSPLSDWFLVMTPGTLLLSWVALFASQGEFSKRHWIAMTLVGILGYGVEVLGVNTGFPFGEYSYGPVLGPSVYGAPPLIGINWILVVLAASEVAARLFKNRVLCVVFAAALMTGFDWVLEPVAVYFNFWTWAAHDIPLSNYAVWFVLSLIFCSLWQGAASERLGKDSVSFGLMWIQVAFFGVLRLILA